MENRFYTTQEEQAGSLRDFLTVLFKHKVMIVTVFLATVITVSVGTFLLPPTYEAKSSLLIKVGREYIYRPEVGDKSPVVSVNHEEALNSEINILSSRDLIEKVITTLKIDRIYPELIKSPPSKMTPLDAATIKFVKKLSVESIKKSNVLDVTFQHQDPKVAADAVNLLIELYKVKHLQVFSGPDSSFLDKQLGAYDQRLKKSANELEAFKQKNQVFSLEEQRSLLLKQRSDLDSSLKNSLNTLEELQKRLISLKSQKQVVAADSSLYTTSERDKIIVEAKSKLLSLQLEEQELLKKYKEGNRLVQHVRNEIQMVNGFLSEQEATISGKVKTGNVVYQEVAKDLVKTEADLNAQRAKAATLKHQVGQLDGELRSLDHREKKMQELKRNSAIMEKNYQLYSEKTEEARISDDMNRSKLANVSIIQVAAVPAKPVKPKKLLNIALGFVLGALSSLGFAFLSEYISQVISTPESAEKRLGLPVLATIAHRDN